MAENDEPLYDAETSRALAAAWGDFGPEWEGLRRLAARRGFPFPPSGTPEDSRDDDRSYRSIVWRWLQDRPKEIVRIVSAADSWTEVVDRIFDREAEMNEELADIELAHEIEKVIWKREDEAAMKRLR